VIRYATANGLRVTAQGTGHGAAPLGALDDTAAINADLDRLQNAMHAWTSDGGYLNFAERPCDVDAILPPEVCERLVEVKRRWDPDGTIRSNHEVVVGA
jgi:hypothetical protein